MNLDHIKFIDFSISNKCQLRCVMCNNWQNEAETLSITLEEWQSAMKMVTSLLNITTNINFSGCESLLIPDLENYIKISHEFGLNTSTATNGYALTRNRIQSLDKAGLNTYHISLDSFLPAIHDKIRGRYGCFRKVIENIRLIKEVNPATNITVTATIMGYNYPHLPEFTSWVQENPYINSLSFQALIQPTKTQPSNFWFKEPEFQELWPGNKPLIKEVLIELSKMTAFGKINNSPNHFKAFINYFLDPNDFLLNEVCPIDKLAFCLRSNGDIVICPEYGKIGNITTDNLEEVLHSPQYQTCLNFIHSCKKNCHYLVNCYFEKPDVLYSPQS